MSNDDLTVSNVRALLGTTRRDARWHLTDELDILCLFAQARFDLRQVETTGNEVVEVTVTCAFGSVDFVVPDGTMVVLDGTSFLASARSDVAAEGESELPRIEITATTVLGRVKIVSPSHDADESADDEFVELTVAATPPVTAVEQPRPAPAAEPAPAPAAEPVIPKPPPAAFVSNGTADNPVVPKAPANKYAVTEDEPDAEPTPPQTGGAYVSNGTADNPVVPKAPANKYAIAEEQPEAEPVAVAAPVAAAQPVIPQPPANKYAVPAEQPSDEPAA